MKHEQQKREWIDDAARAHKSHSAKCGHVKRRLMAGEQLTGKTLAFALDVLRSRKGGNDPLLRELGEKLKKGTPLSEYEEHIMIDVVLVHNKLEGGL